MAIVAPPPESPAEEEKLRYDIGYSRHEESNENSLDLADLQLGIIEQGTNDDDETENSGINWGTTVTAITTANITATAAVVIERSKKSALSKLKLVQPTLSFADPACCWDNNNNNNNKNNNNINK